MDQLTVHWEIMFVAIAVCHLGVGWMVGKDVFV